MIWNLLSNALKFTPASGRVVVSLTQDDAGVRIRIADEGQGIAPSFLPFVFDRFAQSDAASSRQRGGRGLGLSIVKQRVEAHGGTARPIPLSATRPDRGRVYEVFMRRPPVLSTS